MIGKMLNYAFKDARLGIVKALAMVLNTPDTLATTASILDLTFVFF